MTVFFSSHHGLFEVHCVHSSSSFFVISSSSSRLTHSQSLILFIASFRAPFLLLCYPYYDHLDHLNLLTSGWSTWMRERERMSCEEMALDFCISSSIFGRNLSSKSLLWIIWISWRDCWLLQCAVSQGNLPKTTRRWKVKRRYVLKDLFLIIHSPTLGISPKTLWIYISYSWWGLSATDTFLTHVSKIFTWTIAVEMYVNVDFIAWVITERWFSRMIIGSDGSRK